MTDLFTSDTAQADANGRAVVRLQPLRAFERWTVTRMTVQSSSTTLIPTCRVYRGHETPSAQVDGTSRGTMDHSDTNLPIQNGEVLLAVWEGADVGANCTFTIEGKIHK